MKKVVLSGLATGGMILSLASITNAEMIGHWGFDETSGATAYTSVGGINGTLVGNAAFTTGGILGGAVAIHDSDSYVTMGRNFGAELTYSIESWVKTTAGSTAPMMSVSTHYATIPAGYFLSINNNGSK
jgi:hypothetical protein